MASPGRLLLVLLSSFLLCSFSVSADQDQPKELSPAKINKLVGGAKETTASIRDNMDQIRSSVVPFLSMTPGYGRLVAAAAAVLQGVSAANKKQLLPPLKSELWRLHWNYGEYHVKLIWGKPERQINADWSNYVRLLGSLEQLKDRDEEKRHIDEFMNTYSKHEGAARNLHDLLKAEGLKMADKLKCHEKDIRRYTGLINQLLLKGNVMSEMFSQYKNTRSQAKVYEAADFMYSSASVMFLNHKHCLLNSIDYVKKDVEELIDDFVKKDAKGLMKDKAKRKELAQKVWSSLAEMYDRYDWMVVAYLTKGLFNRENKQFQSGFTVVAKAGISVAVARQVKGNHAKAGKVTGTISSCFTKSTSCDKVPQQLETCTHSVKDVQVSQTYSAVHVSDDAAVVFAANDSPPTFIHIGDCKKVVIGYKFVVMVKSDEEITNEDPCSRLDCGGAQRGTCLRLDKTSVAMCECKQPHYGPKCESSLDDYKTELERSMKDETDAAAEKPAEQNNEGETEQNSEGETEE